VTYLCRDSVDTQRSTDGTVIHWRDAREAKSLDLQQQTNLRFTPPVCRSDGLHQGGDRRSHPRQARDIDGAHEAASHAVAARQFNDDAELQVFRPASLAVAD
jgi:hypothetical protein